MSVSLELRVGCSQVDVAQCQNRTGLIEFRVADEALASGTWLQSATASCHQDRGTEHDATAQNAP